MTDDKSFYREIRKIIPELLLPLIICSTVSPSVIIVNPIALKKTKIEHNFGLFECNGVKHGLFSAKG